MVRSGATEQTDARRPVGRRGGAADTRRDILAAAREQFARGYNGASMRAIARDAKVDPSLIVQFFGGKDGLFIATIAEALRPGEELDAVLRGGRGNLGPRLARWFFGLWEDPARRYPIQAVLLSAASHPTAEQLLRRFITEEVVSRVAGASPRKNARLWAELAGSHLIGTALVRYVYKIPPLSEMPTAKLAKTVGEVLDGYLGTAAARS